MWSSLRTLAKGQTRQSCQLEPYFYPFMVGLYSGVHLFFIYLSAFPGLAY
jgi:hypothetical protein